MSACSFDPKGGGGIGVGDGGVADAPPPSDPDAAPDAGPFCVAGEIDCNGRQLRTCNDDGTAFANVVDCPFTCGDLECKSGANLDDDDFANCDDSAPDLTPPLGATLIVREAINVQIECSPHCGDGVTTSIPAAGIVNQPGPEGDLAYFCVGDFTVRANVTLGLEPQGDPAVPLPALALVVDGEATITGTIDVSGKPGSMNFTVTPGVGVGGVGGPGAGNGGTLQTAFNGDGIPGSGLRPGAGGRSDGGGVDNAAGGGGGGGYFGVGGAGGQGSNAANDELAEGGAGGGPAINLPTNSPLLGGSGGGGGAESQTGTTTPCGFPGGGGGGGLQISARSSIALSGQIRAEGGDGFGTGDSPYEQCGAGGGGSGGAVLLEAPVIAIAGTGQVRVNGGSGGPAGGAGGAGASGGTLAGAAGTGALAAQQGGAGAGGGGGRVRLNALTAPACGATVTPTASCSTGALPSAEL
jgi:hypothetical protein